MSETTVSKKIRQLPPAAKKQAQDFVDFLYQRYVKSDAPKKSKKRSITESPFFGMWKDREDMQDSEQWVRDIRKSQWSNPY